MTNVNRRNADHYVCRVCYLPLVVGLNLTESHKNRRDYVCPEHGRKENARKARLHRERYRVSRPPYIPAGKIYGKLTALENIRSQRVLGPFSCACGNTKRIKAGNVKSGDTLSCGCHRVELNIMGTKGRRYYDNTAFTGFFRDFLPPGCRAKVLHINHICNFEANTKRDAVDHFNAQCAHLRGRACPECVRGRICFNFNTRIMPGFDEDIRYYGWEIVSGIRSDIALYAIERPLSGVSVDDLYHRRYNSRGGE